MVVYGNYKQIRGVHGLAFLLNNINKTIEENMDIENKYNCCLSDNHVCDEQTQQTDREPLKVKEYVLV